MEKNKKRGIMFLGVCIITVILFTIFNKFYDDQPKTINLSFEVKSSTTDQFTVYYDLTGDKQWTEEHSEKKTYKEVDQYEKLTFAVPADAKNIRIDFGNLEGSIEVKNAVVSGSVNDQELKLDQNIRQIMI